jgi:hypothetical protein
MNKAIDRGDRATNLKWKNGVLIHSGKVLKEGEDIVAFVNKCRRQQARHYFPNMGRNEEK